MDKSSTTSEKVFHNANKNIKTIENLPQIKISDLSTILYLNHCSEFIIRQFPNVNTLENDDKVVT